MIEEFKIYIDRLKDAHTQKIEGTFSPEIFGLEEAELQFHHPVSIQAEAYTTEEHLVINFSASTTATILCKICNEPTGVPISCKNTYVTIPLEEIKGAVYDFGNTLREEILIEVPHLAECNQGNCPARETLEKFFRSEDPKQKSPFKDIDSDQ